MVYIKTMPFVPQVLINTYGLSNVLNFIYSIFVFLLYISSTVHFCINCLELLLDNRDLMNISDLLNPAPSNNSNPGNNGILPHNNGGPNNNGGPENNNGHGNNGGPSNVSNDTPAVQGDLITERCQNQLTYNYTVYDQPDRSRKVIFSQAFPENCRLDTPELRREVIQRLLASDLGDRYMIREIGAGPFMGEDCIHIPSGSRAFMSKALFNAIKR
jgi:hypothetical protein